MAPSASFRFLEAAGRRHGKTRLGFMPGRVVLRRMVGVSAGWSYATIVIPDHSASVSAIVVTCGTDASWSNCR
jgi:hypothetical protein